LDKIDAMESISINSMRTPFIVFFFVLLMLCAAPCFAVNRTVVIEAPSTVTAWADVDITVAASTDAGSGEQIGFFHAQYSIDGGTTWASISFEETLGNSAKRTTSITVGPAGSKTIVRLRIAFRGGSAGDVDLTGAPIKWEGSWTNWQSPPAKIATINVVAG
jgi:hypothetical protein